MAKSAVWAGRLGTQESWPCGLSEGRLLENPPLLGEGWSYVLIGGAPPTLGRAICFPQSPGISWSSQPKCPHRNTQKNVYPNIWAPRGPKSWHIDVTIMGGDQSPRLQEAGCSLPAPHHPQEVLFSHHHPQRVTGLSPQHRWSYGGTS